MTSFRQLEANRRNATRSTGPITQAGKHRSGETLCGMDCAPKPSSEYSKTSRITKGLKPRLSLDYDAETAVERELVLRLASLLWRIRRATSIETSLLRTQPRFCAIPGG